MRKILVLGVIVVIIGIITLSGPITVGREELQCLSWVTSILHSEYQTKDFAAFKGSLSVTSVTCDDTKLSETAIASQAEARGFCWKPDPDAKPWDSSMRREDCGEFYYHVISSDSFGDVCLTINNTVIKSEVRIGPEQAFVSVGSCQWLSRNKMQRWISDNTKLYEQNRYSKLEGEQCRSDAECKSSICSLVKQDMGTCIASTCTPGSQIETQSDALFCNQDKAWERAKAPGENCTRDYECIQRTGKDCLSCHPEDYVTSCRNNVCVEEKQQNECEKQGLKRITAREDADTNGDGSCFHSLAQRAELTVCAPCGNGICDTMESICNCVEDCAK